MNFFCAQLETDLPKWLVTAQVTIVEPLWKGDSKPPLELQAYAENLILSRCAQLVLSPRG